jgi:DNA-binding NarL/FixJ family response regulator
MIVLVQANVLTVGLNGKSEALRELPIRVIEKQSGLEAARSLKNENVNSVISKWDLVDMEDGRFIRTLRAAKPDIATIVLVRTGDFGQEIAARSLGVSAVLSEDTPDYLFINTVAEILGLHRLAPVTAVSGHRQSITRYTQ